MTRHLEKVFLLILDYVAVTSAFLIWAWLRQELGFFSETNLETLIYLSVIIFLYWSFLFFFFGLYGSWYAKSRVDEFVTIFKTVSIGVFIIFLVTFDMERDLSQPPRLSRMFIVNYWLILLFMVTTSRMLFRTLQKKLLTAGLGHRRTLIVGWGKKGWELSDEIAKYPALGYNVVGFVDDADKQESGDPQPYRNIPLLGRLPQLEQIATEVKAQEIILALRSNRRQKVMDVLNRCNGLPVNFKIVPELYDIIIGQARTNQIYGFPLIDILPQFMPEWERKIKRLMDIGISAGILIGFFPLWLLIAIAIKIDSKGPMLYRQTRVGKDGQEFLIYKFRSMVEDAESLTGPRWAEKRDPRITRVGRVIRALRLDEVPQFLNVLKGEMSLIGPRPERPYFVDKFKQEIPLYTRRLKVKPGITGWAQIKGEYDTSIENVRTKLQYDLFYLENMSLRMDLKILLNTIHVMMMGKGH